MTKYHAAVPQSCCCHDDKDLQEIVALIHPMKHTVATLIRLILWKNEQQRNRSCLLILLWFALWIHTKLLLSLVPLVLFILQSQSSPQKDTQNWVHRFQIVLSAVASFTPSILRLPRFSPSFQFSSIYGLWLLFVAFISLPYFVCFSGILILVWTSPWACILRKFSFALYSVYICDTDAHPAVLTENVSHMDRMYQFAVIHHQRWWPHKGWSDFLLPQDPPTWCDPSLQSVPAIDLFSLPPPILGRGYWLWVDPTWQTVQDAETDHDGWEYAKWDWKQWSSNSAGLAAVTRRKRYVRCARFIEDAGDNDKLEQDSMVGGSASTTRRSSWCTNNSYISSFTTESSSSFTSTID